MIGGFRRRLRTRRARKLRSNARALPAPRLGRTVDRLAALVAEGDGEARLVAVDGLAAVARAGAGERRDWRSDAAATGGADPADDPALHGNGDGTDAGDGGSADGRTHDGDGDTDGHRNRDGGTDTDRDDGGADAGGTGGPVAVGSLVAAARARARRELGGDAAPTLDADEGTDLHPVRERALAALVEALRSDDDGLVAAVSPELRMVVAERPALAAQVDDAYAAALTNWDRGGHDRVAADVGLLIGEAGTDLSPPLPAAQAALRDCLAGPADVAAAAATAYVLAADSPGAILEPGTAAEALAILDSTLDRRLPPEGRLRRYADGRDLRATVRLLSELDRAADAADADR